MSWSLTDSTGISVQGTGQNNAVSVTVDSTNANVIFVLVASYGGAPPVAGDLTDSQSNVYTLIAVQTAAGDANLIIATYYKISPSNNAALQVTFTPNASGYPAMVVYSFTQGSAPTFNTNVQTGTNSTGSVTPGSIGNANDLVVEALAYYTVGSNTINGSFSTVTEVAYLAANSMGLATAWKEIASAVNPVWTTNAANVVAAQAAAVTGVGGGSVEALEWKQPTSQPSNHWITSIIGT
mgnify:CR=1 FL=1